jgi:hypothetical protein
MILIHNRPSEGRTFDRISINCGKRSRKRSRNSGLRISPQKILNPEEVSGPPEKDHPIQ